MRQQATGDAGVALHRGEVTVAVLAADRQSGDEVMEDEVVEDDHPGPAPQGVHDPAVRLRVVADVVERDVGGNGPRPAPPHDRDLHEPFECRQQQR